MKSIKHILLILILWSFSESRAQDFTEDWIGHFSFNQVEDVVRGNGRIYGASENAVFIFSTFDGSIRTLTTVNGLSGNTISSIFFSEAFDTLLIGYDNGIIDVVVGNSSNVITVVDIFNRTSISPNRKRINHFIESNGFAFISTGFGISLYDLGQLEFDDTYFIGDNGAQLNITQTTIQGGFVYASSTDGGLRRALEGNTNIIDFNNWSTILPGSFQAIASLDDVIYLVANNQVLRSFNGINFSPFLQFPQPIADIESNDAFLSIVYPGNAQVYNTDGTLFASFTNIEGFDTDYRASVIENGVLYIATGESGIASIVLNNQTQIEQILPNGPLENNIFNLASSPGVVYAVFGDYTVSYNPAPVKTQGISKLSEEGWVNIPADELLGARNLTHVTINPENPAQIFVSSFRDGLLELLDDVPLILYDDLNSTLNAIVPNDIRVNHTAFDRQGNLWISNVRGTNTMHMLSPGGQFTPISFADLLEDPSDVRGADDLVVANDGRIYLAGSSRAGLLAHDPSSNTNARFFGEGGGANFPIDDLRSLAIDQNGTLWIGTRLGLRILFAPASIFTDPQASSDAIIILQDDIPQELLNDQVVTDIVVDGANNKWVATTDSGVFYFSPNGQETLQHFTTDNSPLPSNNVQDVIIDEASGTVFFGTLRGLVAFRGSETAPAEDLEEVVVYPNPVRPSFGGEVTIDGLTANTNVKITDIVGNLVYEENTTGGSLNWDTTAFGRHRVASGVYLILITGPQALETQIAKLMIIR